MSRRKPMPPRERLCCVLCYALLGSLGWLMFTGNPYPLAITAVAALATSYSQETPKQ